MADLLARFKLIDEMSDRLSRISEAGRSMVEQLEYAGGAADTVFAGIADGTASAVSAADGTASALDGLQEAADNAAASAGQLSDTISGYGDVAGSAAGQIDDLEGAVAEQEETMRQCEQAAEGLGDSLKQACETEEKLAETMEEAARISEELSDNDKVSAETREALAGASQEAADAMQELTAAQQEAEAALAEYEAALSSGTDNLGELEQAAERVSAASDALDEANRRAADATEELAGSTERAADEAENGSERGQDAARQLAGALAAAGIAALVHGMADAFMAASEAAAEFETATMKISTIADTSQVPLAQMSADIMNLSRDTGISVAGLSEAAYSAISASVDTADAVGFTATASKLAAGGFTSSATAVDVLTTALNAYGLEAGQAENISDMLVTTQNLGKTTVDELAASVGKVIPLASAYGVEMDNLSAAYAELTKGGIATAEAGTYLKSMLNELGDSGSTVSAVLLEQTGSTFSALMEQGYSLGEVMAVLGDSVGGNAGAFNELWSSSEAGIGALSLYNAGAEQFNTTLDAMQSSVGATEAAYSAMTDTTAHAQEELANAANNLQISIGQNINPLVEKLYGLGTDVLNAMARFAQEHPIITKIIAATGIGLGVVAVALIAVTTAATATTAAIPALISFGTALTTALGPVGWIAIGITALVAAGAALVSMFEEAEDETAGMTSVTRAQYYELQNLNAEYEEACEKYGETSEEASRLKYQVDDLSAAFEANRQTVEEFTAEVEALCESAEQVTKDFDDAVSEISANETGTLALIQKYEDLSSQANKTEVEMQELEAVTKKLSDTYPDLAAQLDSTTLSAEDYVAAMEKACEQEAERQRRQQAQDTYTEALAKQAQLEDEIAKAEENIRLEKERMDNMSGWDHFWTGGEWDDLEAYQEALDELNAAMEENDATIAEIEQGWKDLAEAEEAAAEDTMLWEEAVSAAYEGVRGNIEELCAAYDEAYGAALESFSGQFGLFDEASTKSDEYLNATVENAQKAVESQLAYWEDYNANIQTLMEYGESLTGEAKENYEELLAYAQDGSEQAAGLARSMADAIKSGDEQAVSALADTVGKVTAKQEEIAAATADWQTDFTAQMDAIEKEMQDTVEGMKLDTEAATSATSTINAYVNAIKAGKGGAAAAAQEVANAVTSALQRANATLNVNVSGGSGKAAAYPAHANGTTNAESMFIAGEAGPELIVSRAAAYAAGTTNSDDFYIAGENGPELIIGQQGSTVFPTRETDRLIESLSNRETEPLSVIRTEGTDEGRSSTGEQARRILLEIAGSGAIEVGDRGGVDKEGILEVLTEHVKPVLLNILRQEIYEEGDLSYEF